MEPGRHVSFQSPTTASTIKHYSQEVCESRLGSASEAQNLLPPRNQQAILSYPRQTIPTLFIRSKHMRLVRYVLVMFQFHLAIRSFPQILMVKQQPQLEPHNLCECPYGNQSTDMAEAAPFWRWNDSLQLAFLFLCPECLTQHAKVGVILISVNISILAQFDAKFSCPLLEGG